jgi:hypothetical protein
VDELDDEDSENREILPQPIGTPQLPVEEYDMDGDLIVEAPSSPDKGEDAWPGR